MLAACGLVRQNVGVRTATWSGSAGRSRCVWCIHSVFGHLFGNADCSLSPGVMFAATLWDTAGQERFRTLTSSFYRGAQGILLVYDITRSDSFDSLEQWLAEVEHFCPDGGKNVAKLLVGNKADLEDSRQVDFSSGEAWARSQGMMFMETSAKTSKHIKEAFDEVLERILESPTMSAGTGPPKSSASDDPAVDIDEGSSAPASGCCG